MAKILPIIAAAVVSLLVGISGTFGLMQVLHGAHPAASAAAAVPPKPVVKTVYYASLSDVTVSVPPEPGQPATSYVLFSAKFATTDQSALLVFDEMQPVIKSSIITRLMNETTQSLQSQQTRNDLMASCLNIVNYVLNKNGGFTPPNPFTAAYIANLVTQE
jgi:flagellar basal body-associated protein FliL